MLASLRPLLRRPHPPAAAVAHRVQARRWVGSCCVSPYFEETSYGDRAFSMRNTNVKYGYGVLHEIGPDMVDLQMLRRASAEERGLVHGRVAVFTDAGVAQLPFFDDVLHSLRAAGVDAHVFDRVRVEPTDASFMEAAAWAREGRFSGYVSVGGGSAMDTCKAALLLAEYPPPANAGALGDVRGSTAGEGSDAQRFLHYVNAPVGAGAPVPSTLPLSPHIAVPTTAGTGSECTGFAICVLQDHPTAPRSKTGIASAAIIPTAAVIDPTVTHSLPRTVVAAAGFDVLSHAAESFTARPFTRRVVPSDPALRRQRPLNQGANPFSDMACVEALRVVGEYFPRALADDSDLEAREQMMWASMVVGTAMGNAGVHLPHGLSYPVCGHVRDFAPADGYPTGRPLVPHGMGVILCAPAVFRRTGAACPDRHLRSAELLGADTRGAGPDDAGSLLADRMVEYIRWARFPNGLRGVGYTERDFDVLTSACFQQKRVIDNAPLLDMSEDTLRDMYQDALEHW